MGMWILLLLTTSIIAAEPRLKCTSDLVWGHTWVMQHLREHQYPGVSSQYIGQGCSAKDVSTIPMAIYQSGSNGTWDAELNPENNGGLNPKFSSTTRSEEKVNGPDKINLIIDELKAVSETYRELLKDFPLKDFATIVNAVGFMRLSQYHWLALMKNSEKLMREKNCKTTTIRFTCINDAYYQKGMTTFEWNRRLAFAQGQGVFGSRYKDKWIDRSGGNFLFHPLVCGKSRTGQVIKSIPLKCGESYQLDQAQINAIKSGPCGALYNKVSDHYGKKSNWFKASKDIYEDLYYDNQQEKPDL